MHNIKEIAPLFLVVCNIFHRTLATAITSKNKEDERYVIYSTGKYELRIRSITERMSPPKTFKIQTGICF